LGRVKVDKISSGSKGPETAIATSRSVVVKKYPPQLDLVKGLSFFFVFFLIKRPVQRSPDGSVQIKVGFESA